MLAAAGSTVGRDDGRGEASVTQLHEVEVEILELVSAYEQRVQSTMPRDELQRQLGIEAAELVRRLSFLRGEGLITLGREWPLNKPAQLIGLTRMGRAELDAEHAVRKPLARPGPRSRRSGLAQ